MVELPITTTTFAIAIASATATSQWNVRFLMQSSPNKSSENVSKGFWHNGSYCEAMTRSQELWQLFWIRNSAFVWTRGKIIPQRLDLRTPKKTLGSIMHASQYIFIFLGIAIFPVVASKPYHILAWFVLYRHIHHPWNQKSYPCEFPKNTNPDKAVAWNPFTFIKINPFPPRSLTICQYQNFLLSWPRWPPLILVMQSILGWFIQPICGDGPLGMAHSYVIVIEHHHAVLRVRARSRMVLTRNGDQSIGCRYIQKLCKYRNA